MFRNISAPCAQEFPDLLAAFFEHGIINPMTQIQIFAHTLWNLCGFVMHGIGLAMLFLHFQSMEEWLSSV